MKQKYIRFVIAFVVLFQLFVPSISQVYAETNNSTKQPEVCAWPSKTMSEYFQFQKDALSAIIWSTAMDEKLSVSDSGWRLFSKKKLTLPSSALDYVVNNIWWRSSSAISTATTSVVLLILAAGSVIESDVEWFAIFFKDRPIVRDYKEMLGIETRIFDVAFSFSQKINLVRSFNWNTVSEFNNVVKEYQKSWLLRKWVNPTWNISMADMLFDLIRMNTAMKYFIAMWWDSGASELRKYAWCLQGLGWKCDASNLVLWFSSDTIDKLEEEYWGNRRYWKCNSYSSNVKSTIFKSVNNNLDTIKSVWNNDMKTSWNNLMDALIWKWTWSKVLTDPCQMSDYQRAQLDAYYWWDRQCWEWISLSSLFSQISKYARNKKTIAWQSENADNLAKDSSNGEPPSSFDLMWDLNSQETTEGKQIVWYWAYLWKVAYNPEFSSKMNDEFVDVFDDINEQVGHSQRAAIMIDLSYELAKIKWLVNQVDAAMVWASELRKTLQDVADYQCSM